MNNNQGLLSLFNEIKIQNTTRISAEDQSFGKKIQEDFSLFRDNSLKYIEVMTLNPIHNDFFNSQILIREIEENIIKKTGEFIHKIIRHFQSVYSISLKTEPIIKKYTAATSSFEIVVDEIILQLNGASFTEQADREIKENLCNELEWARKKGRIKLAKNRLSIDNFVWYDNWNFNNETQISHNCEAKLKKLMVALTHFDCGQTESYQDLEIRLYRDISDWLQTKDFSSKNKFNAIRFYKNGRIDIKFNSAQYAGEFARVYCGYIPDEVKELVS
jgi:hypothetical protein